MRIYVYTCLCVRSSSCSCVCSMCVCAFVDACSCGWLLCVNLCLCILCVRCSVYVCAESEYVCMCVHLCAYLSLFICVWQAMSKNVLCMYLCKRFKCGFVQYYDNFLLDSRCFQRQTLRNVVYTFLLSITVADVCMCTGFRCQFVSVLTVACVWHLCAGS